jgi:hypothetical protein
MFNKRFEEFKKNITSAWGDLKERMDNAWNRLQVAFNKAQDNFK